MTPISQKIDFFRENIPSFECEAGCHDCCGPVTTSSEEISRFPIKSEGQHAEALSQLSCPYLNKGKCEVYLERPLICRLFGTTPRLACPRKRRPEIMIDPKIESLLHQFLKQTRQVLV